MAKVGGATTSGAVETAAVTLGTTQAGSVLGTPAYMAPEEAKGRADIDKRVDIWAFGVVLLFYVAPDGKMMAVPVKSTATNFEPGTPVALFPTLMIRFFPYDVAADGRFLINTLLPAETEDELPITVVLHWRELLKK